MRRRRARLAAPQAECPERFAARLLEILSQPPAGAGGEATAAEPGGEAGDAS